jgi:hypothetical protein
MCLILNICDWLKRRGRTSLKRPGPRSVMKRAVLLFGAGASVDYGAPSTRTLTRIIQHKVLSDKWMKHVCSGARQIRERPRKAGAVWDLRPRLQSS